jgi:hypothetical protein
MVVYLTFYFPMTALIRLLAANPFIAGVGWACAFVLAACLVTPLAFHNVIKSTPLNFLYKRPDWVKLKHPKAPRPARLATHAA